MHAITPPTVRPSAYTWIGLLIALFAMLLVRDLVHVVFGSLTTTTTAIREFLHWLCAMALLLLVVRGERQPLSSIGIGTYPLMRSLLWSVPIGFTCLVIGFAIAIATHFNGGRSGESLNKLPIWLTFLIVVRAGVVEELFYRGYAIERLQAMGLSKLWAAAIPLIIFSCGHWTGGWANIAIAAALGAVLCVFYLWRRDLIANMIAHFAVDFISIVLPRLAHHH